MCKWCVWEGAVRELSKFALEIDLGLSSSSSPAPKLFFTYFVCVQDWGYLESTHKNSHLCGLAALFGTVVVKIYRKTSGIISSIKMVFITHKEE